jgi:hypothetical protein
MRDVLLHLLKLATESLSLLLTRGFLAEMLRMLFLPESQMR